MQWIYISLSRIGKRVIYFLRIAGEILFFFIETFSLILRGRIRFREVLRQIYDLGFAAFSIISVTSFATGMVLAVQAAVILSRFGAREYISKFVGLALVRELGPVLSSIIFVGKSGAKISAEIGAMNVNEQIMATRTLGIDPMDFFTSSRVLACMIALPILVCWSEIVGIFGGLLIGFFQENISPFSYLTATYESIRLVDFLGGLIKTFFFSVAIGIICCYKGFRTSGGSIGVGRYTTEAVALCMIVVIIANFLLTKIILNIWG
jgi:phospholipid/cholesterol/gamma-HCH transport system permease protein